MKFVIKNKIVLVLVLIPIWILIYKYLKEISDIIVLHVFQMTPEKHLTETIRFFIYEMPKVLMLLVLIIFFCWDHQDILFTRENTQGT